jgi:chaperonin cofactor prefoldin
MRAWRLIHELKKLPPDAEVYYAVEPHIIPADDPNAMDLIEVTKVELDRHHEIVLS